MGRWRRSALALGMVFWAYAGLAAAAAAEAASAAEAAPVSAADVTGPPPAAASEVPAKPQEVRVGIYVLSMGKLDVTTGSFTMDFYMSLKSDRPVPESFEFLNGRAASVDKTVDEPNEKFYRILANLSSPINFRRFPFDAQQLQVILEDKQKVAGELVYVPDLEETGLDESVEFPGWQVTGWNATAAKHRYTAYKEDYSQYVLNVGIQRIKMNSFIKTFLPVLFLMLITVSSFILNPDQIVTRLATISSSLVASAMFHISIAGQIPPVSYLTFADKFMMLTYFVLLVSFFLNIAIFVFQGKGRKEGAQKMHRWSERLMFAGVPLLYCLLFLTAA